MRIHAIVFVMIALAAFVVGPVQSNSAAPMATTWYVAPGGNDSNNCQTPATACATIRNDDNFRQLLPLILR